MSKKTEAGDEEFPEAQTVDDVLQKLGGFSFFQTYAALVLAMAEAPCAAMALTMVFTGTRNVDFKCVGNNSSYMISASDPDICRRNCTLELDPTKPVVSIVQEWGLICDRAWLPDFFTSMQMAGMTMGSLVGSQMADGYGRKNIYFATVALMGIFGFVSGIAKDIYVFTASRLIAGIGMGGFYGVYYVYLMEFLTPKWRMMSVCVNIWSLGIMWLGLLAYLIPSWRYLTCTPAIMAMVLSLFYPFMPDTPRWLLCHERTAEAENSLAIIARVNRRPRLTSAEVDSLQRSVLAEKSSEEKSDGVCSCEVFTNPLLRSKQIVFLLSWCAISTVYYSMSFNTKNMSGDPYMNVVYMGLVDFPGFFSGALFNNWLGRRKTYSAFLILACVLLVALVIIELVMGEVGHETLISVLMYCGRFGITGAWGVLTCFTAESFPTTCRASAVGLCQIAANLAGIFAPQLAYLGSIFPGIPYFIFAGLSLAAAGSTLFLKETNKTPLENFAQ